MSFRFTREVFKILVGQICQNIGWHAVQSSPMDILIDVLHRYLLEICKCVHGYSNQYGRTEPNLDDVALAFKDLGIVLHEIEEYICNVEPVPFAYKVPAFPVKHPPKLQYPSPGSRELLYRPEHIPEYLPLMHPDLEEEDGLLSPVLESGQKKNPMEASGAGEGESTSPLSSPKHGTKRPSEWSNDIPVSKKPRHYTEEEGRPMREMTSVFMTPTGFISPAREGKAPEPTLPNTLDSPPSTPEPPAPSESIPVKKEKSKESKKDKSSKSKKDKESSKKDAKKIKTSKKENKENTAFSSEKSGIPSSSSKKEHSSSHKSSKSEKCSMKSSESSHTKIKIDKVKHKEGKEEHKKNKDHTKSSKNKSKMKHSSSSFSKFLKSPKTSKSPQKSVSKSPKKSSSKSPKSEKKASHSAVAAAASALLSLPPAPLLPPPPPPPPPPAVEIKQEIEEEVVETAYEVKEERIDYEYNDMIKDEDELIDSREESPEPRLVIDDSLETQARQERESRLASLDECINAVIQRGQEESEMETQKSHKAVDEVINEVARGPVMRKFEAKDIYDFTDSSDLSSLSSLEPGEDDDDDSSIDVPVIKKEKSKTPESEKSFEIPKKSKSKDKQSKKGKDLKPKSPISLTSPKNRKSPNVIVKREERSPSRIRLKEDIFSSDASSLSPSPSPPPSFSDFPPQKNGPSPKSDLPPNSPFIHPSSNPSTSFSSSPFAPIPPMPCHIQANPHFPTPPLFVTSKSDSSSAFQRVPSPQPLNLAKSSSSSLSKGISDAKAPENHPLKAEDFFDTPKVKSESIGEKQEKSKVHRKEKKEKGEKKTKLKRKGREPKEKEKSKPKVKVESAKEKEKEKPKEIPKPKPEKVVKEVKKRGRPEKKKNKAKEQKVADDSVTRLTLKFAGGNSGSGQFVIKPSSKRLSSPSSSPPREERSPSPPARDPTPPLPSPSKANIQPTPSPVPSPPPAPVKQPSPLPPVVMEPPVPPPASKTHSRGRGRGRKPAAQPAAPPPPARTVITETLGTIVDEEGNKIWICPACTRPDDGSPMIGCDECDDWYHWVCVNIVVPPKEEESWYCSRCIAKRQSTPAKHRRKKHKKGK